MSTRCLLNKLPTYITHLCMVRAHAHNCVYVYTFISATCDSHKGETSLQAIFQMLPVKDLLSVPVIHQVQPHLLWTIDYTVRIAGRLAKKNLQKVNHVFPWANCMNWSHRAMYTAMLLILLNMCIIEFMYKC